MIFFARHSVLILCWPQCSNFCCCSPCPYAGARVRNRPELSATAAPPEEPGAPSHRACVPLRDQGMRSGRPSAPFGPNMEQSTDMHGGARATQATH